MVVIQHARHTVKAETVEAVFIKPEFAVGEQKMQYFVLVVIKAQGIPCHMFTAGSVVEILIGSSVKTGKSLQLIFDGMGMHDVHDHRYPFSMGFIDQHFQFLRRAKTGGNRKEIGDVVSERSVIGVFLYSHELDRIVTSFRDAW